MFGKRTSSGKGRGDEPVYRSYKQCPDCLARMPLNATRCPECNQRVGEIQADGKALKPTDWKSYIVTAILFALFYFFVRWAFFT
ncbi:hypothetical protein [Desulfosudis oleivorans]|uniref:Uncharacterized protein n=1 Tax=Desulfosudis oleivorans (strain DSM 6200 / JCM 39069 / Hxd3) TaxID=96561 RepID=A8ZS61_DESOH|nr:hypothetical protein [Desulfosudis oleivorans]ABW66079.1 hypothetical protein Dole_0269 [Desulfosudis oleivorans Hxd3]